MPAVVPLIVPALVQLAIGTVISIGLSFLSPKPKPKTPNFAPVSQLSRVTMRKEPVVAHQRVYGEVRAGSYLNYMTTTNNKKRLWMVAVLAGHEVDAITTVYLNDEPIYAADMNSAGDVVSGKFAGRVSIYKRLGTADQEAVAELVGDVDELDSNFRGQGISYVVVKTTRDSDGQPFPNGVPNVSARLRGAKIFDPRDDITRWSPNAALSNRDYLRDSLHGLGVAEANVDQAFLAESARRSDDIVDTQPVTHETTSVDVPNDDISVDGETLKFQTGDRIHLSENNSTIPAPLTASDPNRKNWIRNNTMVGAVAVSDTYPTNWLIGSGFAGIDDITDVGVEDGFEYIEIRFNGTPTGDMTLVFESVSGIPAANGQQWTESVFVKLVAGDLTNVDNFRLQWDLHDASYSSTQLSGNLLVDATQRQLSYTATITDPVTQFIQPYLKANWTAGAVDFTIRVYLPMMEQAATPAPTPIKTSGTAANAPPQHYYAIVARERKSSNSACGIKVATSYENAVRNVPIVLTGAGSGSVTVTKDGEPRYTCNGVVDTSRNHREILIDLAGSIAGRILNAGGKWRVIGGFFVPAGEDAKIATTDMRDRPTVVTRHSRRERFNAVKGVYFNPLNFDQPSDYPPVTNATFEASDGSRQFRELDLPFTSRSQQAQRIARIGLRQHRQEIVAKLKCNLAALTIQAGDTIEVTDPDVGWVDKEFDVLRWQLSQEQTEDGPLFTIDLDAQETASASYDFPVGEEQTVDPAPNTNLPAFDAIAAPKSLDVDSGDEFLFLPGDGTVISAMRVAWEAPDDGFLGSYDIEWRLDDETAFQGVNIRASLGTSYIIRPVIDGKTYIVQVQARNVLGVPSGFVTTSHTVLGKSARPGNVDTLLINQQADGTRQFDIVHNFVPADVRVGGGYRIKYRAGTSLGDFATATPLNTRGLIIAFPFESNQLAAGTYTFGVVAVDSSENESANPAIATATLGDQRLRNVLLSRLEHDLGWPGTLTDCFVNSDSRLEANSVGGWAALPATWSALADTWEAILPAANPIVYESPVIDLGIDLATAPLITALGQGGITPELRSHLSDEGADLSAAIYATAPNTLTARYVQVRVTVDGTTPNPDVVARLDRLTIILDGERVEDEFQDINLASPPTDPWFEKVSTGRFKIGMRRGAPVISQAQILALQNVGSGFDWELLDKAATIAGFSGPAAEFRVFNGSGVAADATVDVLLRGPKGS